MEAFAGEDTPEDEVADLQGGPSDVAAVVAAQSLLVPVSTYGGVAPGVLKKGQFFVALLLLGRFIEGAHSRGAVFELGGVYSFCSVDEEEGRLACQLRGSRMY